MSDQLSFDLPSRAALGREDFFISPANALAVAMIDGHSQWPGGKLALCGPVGAGKTHLVQVWSAQTGAKVISANALDTADILALAQTSIAVEDVDRIAGNLACEKGLFHLHNLVLAEQNQLLLTGRTPPSHWPLALPDLASRVQASQCVQLELPDDTLLSAVLGKLFADRQLNPAPDVIPFLALRIDRSFIAAQTIVDALDQTALRQQRAITRKFAADVLDNMPAAAP